MTRRRAACCCDGPPPPTLTCPETNLLCHGFGPKTITIVADSTYSRVDRGWCEIPPAAGYFHLGYQGFGNCRVNLTGVYLSHLGDNGNPLASYGLNRISGTVEMSFTDIWYPTCEGQIPEYELWSYTVTGATTPNVDFSYVNHYGCGHLKAAFICVVSYTRDGIYQGSFEALWTIEGFLCDSCTNPTLVCYPYMVGGTWSNYNPAYAGVLFNFSPVQYYASYFKPGVTDAVESSVGSVLLQIV